MSARNSTNDDTTVYVGNHWIPVKDPFGPRAEELASDLEIIPTARREGVSNLPASTDRDLDAAQRRIIAAGDAGTATLFALGENGIRAAENEIDGLAPRELAAALEEADLGRAVADEKQRCQSELDEKHQARQSAWRQRELFKLENGLTHPAVYGTDITVFVLTLLAVAILEAVGNASILSQATDGGLTGGFLLAVAVGVVNIALGWAVGFFGRGIVHVDRKRRVDSSIVIGVGVAAAFTMHLVLAHLREALEHSSKEMPPIDFSIALRPVDWFAFSSLEPFVLFVAGLFCFVIAVMKGRGGRWGVCDPYPGYAAVDNVFRRCDDGLIDGKQKFKDGIKRAYDEQRKKLRDRHMADEKRVEEVRKIAVKASQLVRDVRSSNAAWLDVTHLLLRKYRQENRRVRTMPTPAYFADFPDFADLRKRLIDDESIRIRVTKAEQVLARNTETLATLEEKLVRGQAGEIEAFIAQVEASERRAERRIVRDEIDPDVNFKAGRNDREVTDA